jgi:hypothetical protein
MHRGSMSNGHIENACIESVGNELDELMTEFGH